MKKVLFIVVVLVGAFAQLKAQNTSPQLQNQEQASVANHLLKIETGLPSFIAVSYERKLSQRISLYNSVSLLGALGGGSVSRSLYGVDAYYLLTPQIKIQPRFYHNLTERVAKNKNVNFNSANYIGLSTSLYHTSYFLTNAEDFPKGSAILDVQVSYGIQRTFFKKLNLDLAIEPGIQVTQGTVEEFIGLNLQLGWIVFSK